MAPLRHRRKSTLHPTKGEKSSLWDAWLEQSFAAAKHEGKCPDPELINKEVSPEGLQQVATARNIPTGRRRLP